MRQTLPVRGARLRRSEAVAILLDDQLRRALLHGRLELPDGDGLAWIRSELAASGVEVIVITGSTSVEAAVSALRAGALDYLTKPFDPSRLTTALMNVARTRSLKRERDGLRDHLRNLGRFGCLVGRSEPMLAVYALIATGEGARGCAGPSEPLGSGRVTRPPGGYGRGVRHSSPVRASSDAAPTGAEPS